MRRSQAATTRGWPISSPHVSLVVVGTPVRFLLLTFSSDWLFPTYQTVGLLDALRKDRAQVSFAEIPSPYGHDAFLLEPEEQRRYLEPFLERALFEARGAISPDAHGGEAS